MRNDVWTMTESALAVPRFGWTIPGRWILFPCSKFLNGWWIPRPLPSDERGMPRTTPPIAEMCGPYRLETGWPGAGWGSLVSRAPPGSGAVSRDYWFAERTDGALLWLYRDPAQDRWYVQGLVE